MNPMKTAILTLIVIVVSAGAASARGPIFDPFYEGFLVGRFQDPAGFAMEDGYPAALWDPAVVDTVMLRAALNILEYDQEYPDPAPVVHLWLQAPNLREKLQPWRDSRKSILQQLISGEYSADIVPVAAQGPMGEALVVQWFFAALARADSSGALALAQQLAVDTHSSQDRSAFRFVWDLRAKALSAKMGKKPVNPSETWALMFDLGPFDAQSGFALWVAHRRSEGLPLLTKKFSTRAQAIFLAGSAQRRLKINDLDAASFPLELKAGLGAKLLRGAERATFMSRYERPPWDFLAQGWWVYGLRSAVHGQAKAYEELAAQKEFQSGWRMDLWRRASELRLLKGQWDSGLVDLRQAVGLARYGAGSKGLRRRVRQWVEQALALAVAQGDSASATAINQLANLKLPEGDRKIFFTRTHPWYGTQAVSGEGKAGKTPDHVTVVRSGSAAKMVAVRHDGDLPASAVLRLENWDQWELLGSGLPGVDVSQRGDVPGADAASTAAQARKMGLGRVASEMGDLLGSAEFLDAILIRDVFLLPALNVGAPSSVWPELEQRCRNDLVLWHGFLGLSLAQQDDRSVVGLANMRQARSLPSDQILHFLYPVPAFGPIRSALDKANSEPALLLAVARNESLFDAGVRSRAGALGWMQIMPFHYGSRGAVPGAAHWSNPSLSIAKGDDLLQENRRRFQGDSYRVLASYNAGPKAAQRWDSQLGQVSDDGLYLAWIGYPETRLYVEKVLKDREIYSEVLAGSQGSDE